MLFYPIDKKPSNIVMEYNYRSEVLNVWEFVTFGQALDFVKLKREEAVKFTGALSKYYCIYTAIDIE